MCFKVHVSKLLKYQVNMLALFLLVRYASSWSLATHCAFILFIPTGVLVLGTLRRYDPLLKIFYNV